MEIDIRYRPAYALGVVTLEGNEEIRVEGGSMVSMSSGVTLETAATGGFLKSLGRSLLGGESFFQNTFRAPASGGQLTVAPALPGDLFTLDMTGDSLLVQSGAYVASEMALEVSTKWGGARTFFASEGLIMLHVAGTGKLVLSSYGAIHSLDLKEGQQYTIDTGHLVAFSEDMGFNVRRIGGMKSTLFSGEGLVVDLTGPGRVLMQTRSADAFLAWLIPQLPQPSSGSH